MYNRYEYLFDINDEVVKISSHGVEGIGRIIEIKFPTESLPAIYLVYFPDTNTKTLVEVLGSDLKFYLHFKGKTRATKVRYLKSDTIDIDICIQNLNSKFIEKGGSQSGLHCSVPFFNKKPGQIRWYLGTWKQHDMDELTNYMKNMEKEIIDVAKQALLNSSFA